MKFGVSTNTYHGYSLVDALDGIAASGFKYVELTSVIGWTEHVLSDMSDQEIDDIKKMISDKNLSIIGLSGHCNIMDDSGLQLFIKNISLAVKLGCVYIITSTGEAHGGEDFEDDAVLVNNLKKIGKACDDAGIICTIETHGGVYNTGERINKLVKNVGADSIGVNYDTANVIFYGKVQPEEEIINSFPSLKYVHLKDKDGKQDEWNFPAVGKGNIDFEKIFKVLEVNKYDGPVSIEIEFTPEGPGSLENVNIAVQDSYSYLQTIGKVD